MAITDIETTFQCETSRVGIN